MKYVVNEIRDGSWNHYEDVEKHYLIETIEEAEELIISKLKEHLNRKDWVCGWIDDYRAAIFMKVNYGDHDWRQLWSYEILKYDEMTGMYFECE